MIKNRLSNRLESRRAARARGPAPNVYHRFEARLESSVHARGLVLLSGQLDSYGIDTIRVAAAHGFDVVQVRVFGSPRGDLQALHDTCGRVAGQLAGLGRRGVRIRVTAA